MKFRILHPVPSFHLFKFIQFLYLCANLFSVFETMRELRNVEPLRVHFPVSPPDRCLDIQSHLRLVGHTS